jgi:protein-L-isoaspartate(D-aspartate) O-methyltransferase
MSGLLEQRRYFAEELQAVCGLRTQALVDAFATVPREEFLPPGPWVIRSETDYVTGAPRHTPDADARRVCHNVAVAIDPRLRRLRRDTHEESPDCWLHETGFCLCA